MISKDLLILSNLRQNARVSLTNMSKKIHMPVSTIFEKIKKHEKTFIKKHTTLIDFSKIGYTARAQITLKVDKRSKEEISRYLLHHPSINSVYKITNGYDFLLEGIFSNMLGIEEFIETLEDKFKIKQKHVYYVIEDLKREGFLTGPEYMLNIDDNKI